MAPSVCWTSVNTRAYASCLSRARAVSRVRKTLAESASGGALRNSSTVRSWSIRHATAPTAAAATACWIGLARTASTTVYTDHVSFDSRERRSPTSRVEWKRKESRCIRAKRSPARS